MIVDVIVVGVVNMVFGDNILSVTDVSTSCDSVVIFENIADPLLAGTAVEPIAKVLVSWLEAVG